VIRSLDFQDFLYGRPRVCMYGKVFPLTGSM